jgi:hypothetical protein
MEHFYQGIDGWFSYEHIYRDAVSRAPANAIFVEIGCWKGRSSSFLVVESLNSNKNITVNCVDTWKGSSEHQQDGDCAEWAKEVANGTLYETFIKNMEPVAGKFNPIRSDSAEAAALFEDGSIDFVMVDAAHEADLVYKDIVAWLPKLKKGGMMAGDDVFVGSTAREGAERALANYNVNYSGNHFTLIIN